jgi:hypothetical protein
MDHLVLEFDERCWRIADSGFIHAWRLKQGSNRQIATRGSAGEKQNAPPLHPRSGRFYWREWTAFIQKLQAKMVKDKLTGLRMRRADGAGALGMHAVHSGMDVTAPRRGDGGLPIILERRVHFHGCIHVSGH